MSYRPQMFSHNHESIKNSAIIGILAVLLALTLFFEFVLEAVERLLKQRRQHHLIQMVETVFREFTALGFISLGIFISTRLGFLLVINDSIFGENSVEVTAKMELREAGEPKSLAPTELFELFEDVHIFIFLIMCVFVVIVTFMLLSVLGQHRRWENYESIDYANLPATEIQDASSAALEFWILKQRFLQPAIIFQPTTRFPDKFHFATYLSSILASTTCELVRISPVCWVAVVLIILLTRPIISFPPYAIAAALASSSVFSLAFSATLRLNISGIKKAICPDSNRVKQYLCNFEEQLPPAMIDEKDFIHQNGKVSAYIQQCRIVSSHDNLFFWGRKGKCWLQAVMQTGLLLHAFLFTIILRMIFSNYWNRVMINQIGPITVFFPLCILCYSALVYCLTVKDFALVSSIDVSANRPVIEAIEAPIYQKLAERRECIVSKLLEKPDKQQMTGTLNEDLATLSVVEKLYESFAGPEGMMAKDKAVELMEFVVGIKKTEDKNHMADILDILEPRSNRVGKTVVVEALQLMKQDANMLNSKEAFEAITNGDTVIQPLSLQVALEGIDPPVTLREIEGILRDMAGSQQATCDEFIRWISLLSSQKPRRRILPSSSSSESEASLTSGFASENGGRRRAIIEDIYEQRLNSKFSTDPSESV